MHSYLPVSVHLYAPNTLFPAEDNPITNEQNSRSLEPVRTLWRREEIYYLCREWNHDSPGVHLVAY
jgi:hypothetical protein